MPCNLNVKGGIFVSRQPIFKKQADSWIPALKVALSELKERNPGYAIEAICVSGNGPTLVSEDCTTLFYNDLFVQTRRRKKYPKDFLETTKSLFIPRVVCFREIFSANWKKSRFVYGAPEFLIHELTGENLTILPEGRFLPAYWTDEELKNCGFSNSEIKKLPPFVSAGAFAGKITEKAALQTGILEGTLVFAGAPDFVVALIGTGTVIPGKLCDRAGTSEGLNLCTSKPVFAEGLRTMPSAVPELWNLSYLMQNKENTDYTDFEELSHGINLLRNAAVSAGESFPDSMTITGGKALDSHLVAQKEDATGLKIHVPPCADAELIGDMILARVGLGDADDITDGVFSYLPQF